ncbi:otopetrin-2-like isoform X1 isoform 2 [Schistosoma japonicum]|uniref:Otopetrin-2-like isoform X1 isoform 2 n=1 Tax=Schistosoma japonicum TaxID=6182 RepID=A0A4Z2CME1_SCHJA|nr:otopetrin-2-like isoform X1 isoform 2 [Schistosoma japonicum]
MNMCKIHFNMSVPEPGEVTNCKSMEGDEGPLKVSANSARKAKNHSQRVVSMFYCFLIFAVGLSITLYNTGGKEAETENSFVAFYTVMFISSIIIMVFTLAYVHRHRYASLEAIEKGELSAPRIAFSFRGEAVNLYLRFGIGLFAAMSIVHSASRYYEVAKKYPLHAASSAYVFFKILFFITQTVFLLLLHRIVILVRIRIFSFILLHVLTVNLCIWSDAVVKKISASIGNLAVLNLTTVHKKHELAATNYFLPAVPEYCAIAVAVVYELLHRIGQLKQIERQHEKKEEQPVKCIDRGSIGIVIGTIIICIVMGVVMLLEIWGKTFHNYIYIAHSTETSILFIIALIFCVIGIFNTRKLKFSAKHNNILLSVNKNYVKTSELQSLFIYINVALPMVMLYRYHSSVCLAIEYIRVYEDEITRYESMLRGVGHTKLLPFGSKWEVIESQDSNYYSQTNLLAVPRTRALSEPAVKPNPVTVSKEFHALNKNNTKYSSDNLSNVDEKDDKQQIMRSNKLEHSKPNKYNNQNKRRTTHVSMELAQYRVNASEMKHRLAEMKLKKYKRGKDDHSINGKLTLNKFSPNKDAELTMSASLSDSALSTVRTTDTINEDDEDDITGGVGCDDYTRQDSLCESYHHTKADDSNTTTYLTQSQL